MDFVHIERECSLHALCEINIRIDPCSALFAVYVEIQEHFGTEQLANVDCGLDSVLLVGFSSVTEVLRTNSENNGLAVITAVAIPPLLCHE